MRTILGVSFDHKTETPGLGAEINKPFFMDRWKSSMISDDNGDFKKYEVVKDNSSKRSKQSGWDYRWNDYLERRGRNGKPKSQNLFQLF